MNALEEEIRKFAEDIDFAPIYGKNISKENRITIAKALLAMGYHRIQWHVIKNNPNFSLPKDNKEVWIKFNNTIRKNAYSTGMYIEKEKRWIIDDNLCFINGKLQGEYEFEVIAWTECLRLNDEKEV